MYERKIFIMYVANLPEQKVKLKTMIPLQFQSLEINDFEMALKLATFRCKYQRP